MNTKIKLSLLTFMVLAFAVVTSAQPPNTKSMSAEFDKLLSAQFKPGETGCAALVAINGQIIYKKAFGMANLELNVPMQPDMVFRIGSITKQFTAIAILQLMEQGKLSLQDDITKFIPDYPTQAYKITVENLLTHTSGIKSYTNVPEFMKYMKDDFKPEEVIDKFKNLPMEFAPGTKWNYNNSGFFLLGYIIEKVSGMKYRDYIEQNLFKPAGMTNSLYGSDTKIIKNRAYPYQSDDDITVNADYMSMLLPYSAGSLMSTVEDLYKWNRALISGKFVKKETLEKAWTEYKLSDGILQCLAVGSPVTGGRGGGPGERHGAGKDGGDQGEATGRRQGCTPGHTAGHEDHRRPSGRPQGGPHAHGTPMSAAWAPTSPWTVDHPEERAPQRCAQFWGAGPQLCRVEPSQLAAAATTRPGAGSARSTRIPDTPETSEPTRTPRRASSSRVGSPPNARLAMNSATVNPTPATMATPYTLPHGAPPGTEAAPSFTAAQVKAKMPSCFPTNSPTAVPRNTGAVRLRRGHARERHARVGQAEQRHDEVGDPGVQRVLEPLEGRHRVPHLVPQVEQVTRVQRLARLEREGGVLPHRAEHVPHRSSGHRRHEEAQEHPGQRAVHPRVVEGDPLRHTSRGVEQRALHPDPRAAIDHQRQHRDPGEPLEVKPAPVEEGDHQDAADVVEDRERGEEDQQRPRHAAPEQHDAADGEGDVGGHRDGPAPLPGRPAIEGEEDERREEHASGRGDGREERLTHGAQLALDELALDLHPHDEEEDGHQPVVDDLPQADLEARGPEPHRHRRRP